MNTTRKPVSFLKLNLVAVLGLALAAFPFLARAADQPQPGPEHQKLEVFVGSWTYEGVGEATPFWPAGKFSGKTTAKMVLGGFFLESRAEDKGDSGYIYQSVGMAGYDPVTKTYPMRGFENDGNTSSGAALLSGNTWTITGTRTDSKGKVYKTKVVQTFASDGRSFTEVFDYSADDGKTWLPGFKDTVKKVGR